MNRALFAAASGMSAQQEQIDVVADNLANADVIGFKNAQASFNAIGADARLGVAPGATTHVFSQGKIEKTGGPFDLAIEGPGFFVLDRGGERAYTRDGSFSRRADGTMQNSAGWKLAGINVPRDAISVDVAGDGRVRCVGANGSAREIGRVRVALFNAPERLRVVASSIFVATPESGAARVVDPGGDRRPHLVFGALERSNVSIIESMMAILTAQRAYEANAKGVQAADEMLRIANNLHRS